MLIFTDPHVEGFSRAASSGAALLTSGGPVGDLCVLSATLYLK